MQETYVSKLNLLDTEKAIKLIKDTFEKKLSEKLSLTRVSAPLFVLKNTGLNDNLSGSERAVTFDIKESGEEAEIVHSLAKWKRYALAKYNVPVDSGIYTDMNAIRRDEITDNIHSLYVDQWDWERVISREERNLEFLKSIVRKIYSAIKETGEVARQKYPVLEDYLTNEISFITTQELEDMYPNKEGVERETAFVKEYGAMFLMQIGDDLKSGKPHDSRAPDYDDWALNGDIIIYYPPLGRAFELSSMGIRVDEKSLLSQLEKSGETKRATLPFHSALLKGELPLTIGGGIGQSRLCMFMLNKLHIGEVQSSIWPEEKIQHLKKQNINLL